MINLQHFFYLSFSILRLIRRKLWKFLHWILETRFSVLVWTWFNICGVCCCWTRILTSKLDRGYATRNQSLSHWVSWAGSLHRRRTSMWWNTPLPSYSEWRVAWKMCDISFYAGSCVFIGRCGFNNYDYPPLGN